MWSGFVFGKKKTTNHENEKDRSLKKTRCFISGHRIAVKTEMIAIIPPHKNTYKEKKISVRR